MRIYISKFKIMQAERPNEVYRNTIRSNQTSKNSMIPKTQSERISIKQNFISEYKKRIDQNVV